MGKKPQWKVFKLINARKLTQIKICIKCRSTDLHLLSHLSTIHLLTLKTFYLLPVGEPQPEDPVHIELDW